MYVDSTTLSLLCPEIILVFLATFIFVAGAFRPEPRWWTLFTPLTLAAVLGLVMVGIEWPFWQTLESRNQVTAGPVLADALSQWTRLGTLAMGLLMSGLMAGGCARRLTSESLGLFLLVIAGVMVVCRANDLVLLFVGLELISVPTYVLLFLSRRNRSAAEAAVKYFFLSILSSALLLYGFSFLYGMSGATQLIGSDEVPGVREALLEHVGVIEGRSLMAALATILMLAGLGFKITAVPFHFYAPDVYQGTSNSVAALLAVAPKIAGFVALVRLFVMVMPESQFAWQLTIVLAALTMTLGNIGALWQTNLRRLLAYSSIAHGGYLMIGLTVALGSSLTEGIWAGVSSLLFYLATYCVASIAAFAALDYIGSGKQPVQDLSQLAGLGRTQPLAAGILAVSMFSLAGIPIFAGFWGKLNLFLGALQAATVASPEGHQPWFFGLAVIGALNAAVAAAYYLRVVGAMYFQPSAGPVSAEGGLGTLATMVAAGVIVIGIGLAPKAIFMTTSQAATSVVEARPSPTHNGHVPAALVQHTADSPMGSAKK